MCIVYNCCILLNIYISVADGKIVCACSAFNMWLLKLLIQLAVTQTLDDVHNKNTTKNANHPGQIPAKKGPLPYSINLNLKTPVGRPST